MKKDGFTVMFSVSKATGHLLDHLDFAVETLGDRIPAWRQTGVIRCLK